MNGGSSSFAHAQHNHRHDSGSTDVTMTPADDIDSYPFAQASRQNRYWGDDFRPLRDAGKNILEMLRRDETSVHGDLYRRIMSKTNQGQSRITGSSSRPTISDVNPSHRYFPSKDDNKNEHRSSSSNSNIDHDFDVSGSMKHTQTIPLPPYLRQVRSKAKAAILMGLFPEAQMAWMTSDSTVYLWAYHQNSGNINGIRGNGGDGVENQFLEFKVPSGQPIISVGLAPPKQGVFRDVVEWCLVVTTKEEAMICALAKASATTNDSNSHRTSSSPWTVVLTKFIIPSDWISFLCITSTKSGRVFLGGQDGNVYELEYDLLVKRHLQQQQHQKANGGSNSNVSIDRTANGTVGERLEQFYDGSDDISSCRDGGSQFSTECPDILLDKSLSVNQSTAERVYQNGKRVFEIIVGSDQQQQQYQREPPRKCRKINHSQNGILRHLLPDFVSRVGHSIFSVMGFDSSTTTAGGAITQMIVDDERQVLYTLSSPKGWICAMDLSVPRIVTDKNNTEASYSPPAPALAAVLDAPATARSYLEAISRGRLHPPQHISGWNHGSLQFLGNSDAAQAGVGGMDGARRILKIVEQAKMHSNGRTRRSNSRSRRNNSDVGLDLLTPVSIRIVPNRESTRITLVAITSGGIRYYLSTLNPNMMGVGPSTGQARFPRRCNPWKPHHRFTLCHVKAPPPVIADSSYFQNDNGSNTAAAAGSGTRSTSSLSSPKFLADGVSPTVSRSLRVDASCYLQGTFLVAFQPMGSVETGGSGTHSATPTFSTPNDILIATTPDSAKRVTVKKVKEDNTSIEISRFSPGGICEIVSNHLSQSKGIIGGRIWDIEPSSHARSKVLYLALHSKTPSDLELRFGMTPTYIPKSSKHYKNSKTFSSSLKSTNDTVVPASDRYFSSVGLTVFVNMLMGRYPEYGLTVKKALIHSSESIPSYRISLHSGSDGFSFTATDTAPQIKSSPISRSIRLSPWLLRPDVAPLDPLALQHLERHESTFLALNSEGIHSYQSTSLMGRLSEIILAAGMNVRTDLKVTKFFENYGYEEGCSMCLMLAIQQDASDDLKEWSIRAALQRAYCPKLTPVVNNHQLSMQRPQSSEDESWIPNGYNMELSAICKGLYLVVARLLRPIWYKPAVVVTEGRVVKRGSISISTPSKVELLLDDDILQEINQPIKALEEIVAAVFRKAIESIPMKGVNNESGMLTIAGAEELARDIEERHIHSVYRLLSRTTQLLNLLSCLRRAHSMPDLPEVEWGLLHGIQIAQLVQTSDGQERIEGLLNKLVTSGSNRDITMTSADTNNLANILSQQCYHYFSPGNRYSYLGFQMAKEAMSLPKGQSRRAVIAKKATEYLKEAAKNWFSAKLITGRLLHTRESEGFTDVAERAIQYSSPLARATAFLVELEDVKGLVDVCLITAMNFKVKGGNKSYHLTNDAGNRFQWESGLYHKKPEVSSGSTSNGSTGNAKVLGTNVTSQDAIQACYSLIFYYMSKFLNSHNIEEKFMGDRMVSVCANEHADKEFLHAFFDHLLKNNHKDVLLRVTSSDLEKWLSEKCVDDFDLLLNYYQIQESDFQAGQVALKYAQDENQKKTLNDRIEYLEISIVSFSSALKDSEFNRNGIQSELNTANGLLGIAKLQNRIFHSIDSTIYVIEERDLQRLEYSLLDVTTLYNDFAFNYDMFEICLLLIYATGKYDDIGQINKTWKDLLCAEVFPCSTRNHDVFLNLETFREGSSNPNQRVVLLDPSSNEEHPIFEKGLWMSKVKETVIRLGEHIFCRDANVVFPVDFVGECLEDLRRTYALADVSNDRIPNQDWTFGILLAVGVPFRTSFDTLYKIMEDENRGIDDSNKHLSNIEALVSMLQSFVEGLKIGRLVHHDSYSLELTNAVERVKMLLQALPEDVTECLERLERLEGDIQRITR